MADVLPTLDRLALAVAHLPGPADTHETGGAWYDVTTSDDGSVAVTVGDGGSATVARRLRAVVTGLGPGRRAADVMDRLDQAARQIPAFPGGTALCVTLDPAGVLGWSSAGHTPPLLAGPGGVRYLDGGQGEPLGRGRPPAEGQETLSPGTTVVLCTGGSPASCSPAADEPDQVAAGVARHHGLAPAALARALAGQGGNGSAPAAGRTLLLVRLLPAPLEQRLPAEPQRLAAVRRTVAAWSAQAALSDDAAADLQLLLSEAATNAVEHAYRGTEAGEFVYSVRRLRDAGVRVVVQDFGRWRPPPDDPGYRGRGLAVIHNLAEEVSLDFSDHGTRIAFTVPSDLPPLGERPLTGVTQGWRPDLRPGNGSSR
jgi:anti-sigma regulatory factor (Ser/Thr protein kinase)